MTIIWPAVLEARRCSPNLRNAFRSGGRSISGIESRVISDAAYWEVSISEIRIHERDEARAFRSMVGRLRAGEAIEVAIFDAYLPDGAESSLSLATLASPAALRATQITVNVTGIAVEDGHHFSIGDRLHLITEVISGAGASSHINPVITDTAWLDEPWTDDATASSAQYQIKFKPPLRAEVAAGTAVRFKDLTLLCVVKDPLDGDPDLDLGRLGAPSLTFIEDF